MTSGLCVGGGIEQVPSIRKAKEMGYRVFVVDKNPLAPGFAFADDFAVIDIKNEERVIEYAKEKSISFCIPAPIGRFLTTVGAVNEALHLRGILRKSALYCTDKILFNNLMEKAGIPVAKQKFFVPDRKEIETGSTNFSLPFILKPQFGSGSRAITVIRSREQLQQLMDNWDDYVSNLHKNEMILIEQYIDGVEHGVDALIVNGTFYLILIREKVLNSYSIVTTYKSPAQIERSKLEKIAQIVEKAAEIIKLDNCLIQADIVIEKETREPYLIELTGRPAGLFIHEKIIPFVTGINFLEIGIDVSLGKTVSIDIQKNRPLVSSFFPFYGILIQKPNDKDVYCPDLVEYNFPFQIGEAIPQIQSTRDILERGWVSFTGKDVEDAENKLLAFLLQFKVF